MPAHRSLKFNVGAQNLITQNMFHLIFNPTSSSKLISVVKCTTSNSLS